ncbi:YnbE family lipoprotein [Blastomonas sp.]|uniref:YnbE family lipoprotein n=1 Tax=Blastomonas sp. TaxID=1909299 RepID=UPI00391A5E53
MAMMRNPAARLATLAMATGVLAGCVTIAAPDKPIVINLNINIKQEVVYRLDGKAKAVIDENAEIF